MICKTKEEKYACNIFSRHIKFFIGALPALFILLGIIFPVFNCQSQDKIQSDKGNNISTESFQGEKIGIDDGLSQGFVSSIIQDKEGFMWFGTRDGLNKYDGYTFKVYRHDAEDTNSISGNVIHYLFEDSHSRIWIGLVAGGVDLFDKQTGIFTHLQTGGKNSIRINSPDKITEGTGGAIWLTSVAQPGIIDIIHPIKKGNTLHATYSFIFEKGENSLMQKYHLAIDKNFMELFPETSKSFWIATTDSVFYLHDNKIERFLSWNYFNSFIPIEFQQKDNHPILFIVPDTLNNQTYFITRNGQVFLSKGHSRQLSCLNKPHKELHCFEGKVDYEGRVWMPTAPISCFDPRDSSLHLFENASVSPSSYFRRNLRAAGFYISRNGTLWIGTVGYGIVKFNPQAQKFNFYQYQYLAEENSSITGFCEGSNNKIMASIEDNWESPIVFNYKQKKFEKQLLSQTELEDLRRRGASTYLKSMVKDENGNYWAVFGNDKLVSFHENREIMKAYNIDKGNNEPLLYLNDYLWYANNSFLYQFDQKKGKTIRQFPLPEIEAYYGYRTLSALADDHNGIFWLGTINGLYRLDTRTSEMKAFKYIAYDIHSLSSNIIFSLLNDPVQPETYLWVGTNGGGLNKFNKITGECIRYSTKTGLPNNVIYGILNDNKNRLWLSSNKGLSCLDPATGAVKNYTKEAGLQSNEFNRYAYLKTSDGKLFFGGVNGLNFFSPDDLDKKSIPPEVVFTDLKIDNRIASIKDSNSLLKHPIINNDTIVLPWYKNIVSFSFAVMDFAAPTMNTYKYKLEGVDKNWIDAGAKHEAGYTNLSPGKYIFYVYGANSTGTWSKFPARIWLIIRPPWWLTLTAKISYVLLTIAGILLFVGLRTRYLRRRTKELEVKVKERTEELETAQAKMIIQRDELAEANDVKSSLFSIISHDLRSPLNSLEATLVFLKNEELTKDEMVYFVNLLNSSLRGSMNLLDNLLTWSLSQMKGIIINLAPVNLNDLVEENIFIYKNIAGQKGVSVQSNLHFPAIVFADEHIVNLVIRNILNNALKFSRNGGNIYFDVKTENKFTVLSVKDEGIGIEKDRLENIFKLGDRTKVRRGTANEKGTGLGLPLCYDLISQCGGKITVESEEEKGTTFFVYLTTSLD